MFCRVKFLVGWWDVQEQKKVPMMGLKRKKKIARVIVPLDREGGRDCAFGVPRRESHPRT